MDRKIIITLRNVLSNLYPTEAESRRVVKDSGIPPSLVSFNSKAIINWDEILEVAENMEFVTELIDVALKDYPRHPVLREFKDSGGKIAPTTAPVIDTDITWRSTPSTETLEKLMQKESTLLPVSFLEVGMERSRAVARVKLPEGTGTGFITGDNIFVTNHHVLKDAGEAKEALIQFNYQDSARGLDLEPTDFKLDPDSFFATSEEDDWTLVRVKGDANKEWGKIDLKPVADYKKIEYVNIIQHPRGGPKQIAIYHNIVAYADDKRLQYLTDTLEGSSGSPVFDNRWRVVALHHSGGDIIEPDTKKPVFRNEGININIVVDALQKVKVT